MTSHSRRNFLGLGLSLGSAAVVGGVSGGSASAAPRTNALTGLRRHLDGDVVLPGDPRYALAKQSANGQFDAISPRAIAYCTSERDVRTVLAYAQHEAVPTAIRSGGHSFGGYSTSPGIVLDVSRLRTVDFSGTEVTLGPGTQMVDALAALAPHGRVIVGGTCPTVCVGGFLQGGGVGWQTRKFGMACDQLLEATVVLADGRIVRSSDDEHPDLFWALRGNGGGNYGVVTSYRLRPAPVTTVVNWMLTWPWDAAADVAENWQQWAVDSPDDLAANLIVMNTDAATGVPMVFAYGTWYSTPAALDQQLDALVAAVGTVPATRSATPMTPYQAMMEYYGCSDLSTDQCHRVGYSPEARMPRNLFYRTRNRMFADPVSRSGVDRMLSTFTADPGPGQFRMIYFETLGGQANRRARTDTAYVHRTTRLLAGFSLSLTREGYTAADVAAAESWLGQGYRDLQPGSLPESYQNYMDPSLESWRQAYYGENYPRLVQIKRQYDPHGFFRFAQSIG